MDVPPPPSFEMEQQYASGATSAPAYSSNSREGPPSSHYPSHSPPSCVGAPSPYSSAVSHANENDEDDDGMPEITLVDNNSVDYDPLITWAAVQPTHQVQTADVQLDGIRFDSAKNGNLVFCNDIAQRYPNDLHFVSGCGNLTHILDNDVFYQLVLAFYSMGAYLQQQQQHTMNSLDNALVPQLQRRAHAAGCTVLDDLEASELEQLVRSAFCFGKRPFRLHGGREDTEPLLQMAQAFAQAKCANTSKFRFWTVPEVQDAQVKKKSRYPSLTQEQWDQGSALLQEMTDNLALLKKRLSSPMRQAYSKICTSTRNSAAKKQPHGGKAAAVARSLDRKRKATTTTTSSPTSMSSSPVPQTSPTPSASSPESIPQQGKRVHKKEPRRTEVQNSKDSSSDSTSSSWQEMMQRYLAGLAMEPHASSAVSDRLTSTTNSWQTTLPACILPRSQRTSLPLELEHKLDAALRVDGSIAALEEQPSSSSSLLALQYARVWMQQDASHRFVYRIDTSTPESWRRGYASLIRHVQQQQPTMNQEDAANSEASPDEALAVLQQLSREFQWMLILDGSHNNSWWDTSPNHFFSTQSQWWNTRGRFLLVGGGTGNWTVQSLGLNGLPQTERIPTVPIST